MLDPHALPIPAAVSPDARPARRLTWDSRQAGPEVAFVALPGEAGHGNAFLRQALDAGAPFVLTDKKVERAVRVPDALAALKAWALAARDSAGPVVGITGSVGKTTAKAYAAAALNARFMPVYNTVPATACFLIENSHGEPLVVEMGVDRPGDMAELMEFVRPAIGVVTAIGATHLERLGSVAGVAREKGGILAAPRGLLSAQAAPFYPDSAAEVYGFGRTPGAGEPRREGVLYASGRPAAPALDVSMGMGSTDALVFDYAGATVRLPGAAPVQAEAALLGMRLAELLGVPLAEAAERLGHVGVPGGRYTRHPGVFTVIDDAYNASPLACEAALHALAQEGGGRKLSVLGTMLELGDEAAALHARVGETARECAGVRFGVGPHAAALGERAVDTVDALLPALLAEVRPGDMVLVKASRGASLSPDERSRLGVGLERVVAALRERQAELESGG